MNENAVPCPVKRVLLKLAGPATVWTVCGRASPQTQEIVSPASTVDEWVVGSLQLKVWSSAVTVWGEEIWTPPDQEQDRQRQTRRHKPCD